MDLRANTAVDVLIGPFVDKTDGNTTEDGLTLTQAEIKLSKNGQALAQKNDNTNAAFDDDGYYNCELDSTDTNTEGNLVLIVHQSANALPVRHEFNVLSEAAWDSLYVAKDDGFLDVNIKTVGRADTQETEANNLESACSNYSVTRGLTGTAVPAVAADGVGGLPISDAGGLDLDAILADTNELQGDWTNAGRLDAILDVIAADTTTDIPALIATAQADLDTITGTAGVLIGTDVMDRSATLDVNTKTITNGIIAAATLGADCITSAKIADDAISSEHLNTGALTADAFAADALVAATFATGALTADAFAANALVAATFAADCITSAKIADDAIAAEHIASGAIVAATLEADCITAAKIADDAISSEHLNTGALTADAFAADALVAATFATDSIAADALASDAVAEIVDGVWDEPLTGASHNDATSAGRRLRQANLGQAIAHEGTAQAGGNNTITLADGAEDTTDDLYHEALCFIAAGTGAGQVRFILSYVASTRVATVHVDWEVNPAGDSEYVIYGNAASNLHAIQDVVQSATDLKDFVDAGYDPNTNKVQGVVLVDTCTTNTDLVTAAAVVNEWETQSQADPTGFHVNVLEVGGTSQTANDNGADINAIKVITDALTAAAAAKLALSAAGIVSGAAEAGTLSTTQMTTDLSEATDDHYIGRVIVWTSGVLDGQATDITDYAGATGLLTFTAVTEAPSATDTFVIM